jgi:hypothetical protein
VALSCYWIWLSVHLSAGFALWQTRRRAEPQVPPRHQQPYVEQKGQVGLRRGGVDRRNRMMLMQVPLVILQHIERRQENRWHDPTHTTMARPDTPFGLTLTFADLPVFEPTFQFS